MPLLTSTNFRNLKAIENLANDFFPDLHFIVGATLNRRIHVDAVWVTLVCLNQAGECLVEFDSQQKVCLQISGDQLWSKTEQAGKSQAMVINRLLYHMPHILQFPKMQSLFQ